MPSITLYELGPTRSARCRWALHEAGLPYESVGNSPEVIHSDELKGVHPLGKLPAAVLDTFLSEADFLVENRFTVTDIIVGYTVNFGLEQGLLGDFPNLIAYLDRLFEREHCTLIRPG
jgi:glutathione S-transferase